MSIKINSVSILNKSSKIYLYKDMSFIFDNDYYLIDGKNGIGKSVLLKVISNLSIDRFQINGTIEYDLIGLDCSKTILSQIAYLPQEDIFATNNVLDEVLLSAKLYERAIISKNEVEELFEKFNISYLLNKKISKLSGGERKLVSLMCFFIRKKNALLYVLDEPFNNLDNKHIEIITSGICKLLDENRVASVLMVSHYKNDEINKTFNIIRVNDLRLYSNNFKEEKK